jgi:hypothetical protein
MSGVSIFEKERMRREAKEKQQIHRYAEFNKALQDAAAAGKTQEVEALMKKVQ